MDKEEAGSTASSRGLTLREAFQLLDRLNDEITRAQAGFAAGVAQILSRASRTPLSDAEVNKALVDRFQETAARVEHRVKCPTCGLAGTLSYAQGKFKIGHRVTSHGFGDALPDASMTPTQPFLDVWFTLPKKGKGGQSIEKRSSQSKGDSPNVLIVETQLLTVARRVWEKVKCKPKEGGEVRVVCHTRPSEEQLRGADAYFLDAYEQFSAGQELAVTYDLSLPLKFQTNGTRHATK